MGIGFFRLVAFVLFPFFLSGSVEAAHTEHCQWALAQWSGLDTTERDLPDALESPVRPIKGAQDVVVVLLRREAEILFGKRYGAEGSGTWGNLGGKIEVGESIEAAARREAWEEAEIQLRDLKWVDTDFVFQSENQTLYRVFIVTATTPDKPRIVEDKVVDFVWAELDRLPEPLFKPNEDWLVRRLEMFQSLLGQTLQ